MAADPDLRADREDRPPTGEGRAPMILWLAGAVIAAVLVAWIWRAQQPEPASPAGAAPRAADAPAPAASTAPTAPAPAPVASGPRYPLSEATEPPLPPDQVDAALADLIGAKAVTSFLQTDGFARRVAATVDSLGREHAPVAARPVLPVGGRFLVEERPDGTFIAPENAARYAPFVLLVGTLDVERAVRLYRRMYPMLQGAYRALGFGDRYFNDRVLEVIDLLLATPEPEASPRLVLTEVKGPIPSTQPWVRYRFADPQLESLAAGQKILVRVGAVNERRLKAKLSELRAHILAGGATPAVAAASAASAATPASAAAASPPASASGR